MNLVNLIVANLVKKIWECGELPDSFATIVCSERNNTVGLRWPRTSMTEKLEKRGDHKISNLS